MKKRILTILSCLFVVLLAFCAAACGEEDTPETTSAEYTVTLAENFEGGGTTAKKYAEGASLAQPAAPAAPEGLRFSHWSYDLPGQSRVEFPVEVRADLTLYAQWEALARFTLKFTAAGASEGSAPQEIAAYEGSTVGLPSGEGLARDFYIFGGWTWNGNVYAPGAQFTVTEDAVFSPVWTPAVTVRFEAGGAQGNVPAEMAVAENTSFTLPAQGDLVKEGYTFDGWLVSGGTTPVRAGNTVNAGEAETIICKAAWRGLYEITFDTALKREPQFESPVETGTRISLPEAAEVEEKQFVGWEYNGRTYEANARFTVGYEDIEFASVYRDRGVNIAFYDADRSLIRNVFFSSQITPSAPADIYPATLSEFTGWKDASGGDVDLASVTEDTSVYASYSVQFADASLFTYESYRDGWLLKGKSSAFRPGNYVSMNFPAAYGGKPVYGTYDGGTLSGVFYGEGTLQTVYIPSNWTKIGNYTFYKSSLKNIEFAEGGKLASIGNSAFSETALTEISVPDSVTEIGRDAFSDSVSLQTVTFGAESGVTKFSDGTENERTSIFEGCTSLKNVTLPGHLEVIGLMAFQNCAMTSVQFPASLRIIGQSAFDHCAALESVTFPAESVLEEVQRAGFGWCSALRSIELPQTVRSIAYNAFTACEKLESISFGDVTSIGETAFARCFALKRVNSETDGVFNIPASVREIGIGAFAMCMAMREVHFGAESALKTVGGYAFAANVYHDPDHAPEGEQWGNFQYASVEMSLQSIEFPAGVEKIGKYVLYNVFTLETLNLGAGNAFYTSDGRGLYENATHKLIAFALGTEAAYTLAADCTAMDEYVFAGAMREGVIYGSPKVKKVTLSVGLETLPYTAFLCNTELTEIEIPAGSELTTIDEAAFANCIKLEAFNFGAAEKLKTIGVEAFEDVALVSVTLPASLTEIGNFAFYKADVQTVQFAPNAALKTIGVGAFMGSYTVTETGETEIVGSALRTFTLPGSVESVGTQAFAYTSQLETFTFGEGSQLTGFSNNMFQMSGVQHIVNIPASLTEIGQYAFMRSTRLTEFTMENVAVIGLNAFSGSAIQTVILRGAYETLTVRTFDTCKSLTSVTLGDSVRTIDNYAFIGCTSLEEIVIPASCRTFGTSAFRGCTSLRRITLPCQNVVNIAQTTFLSDVTDAQSENIALDEVNVPAALVERYKADTYWSAFADKVKAIAG